MWISSTHAAHTDTPSVLSQILTQMLLSEATCCGTSERMAPISSSALAKPCMVARKLCRATRIGSACGSSRVELVSTKTFLSARDLPSTYGARLKAVVAPVSLA